MESFSINNIKCHLLEFPSQNLCIFIGGDSDTKDTYLSLGKCIINQVNTDILLFSFTGREEELPDNPKQLIKEIYEIFEYLLQTKRYKKHWIVCTSSGSVASTYLLCNSKYSKMVSKAIYLDPADHYTDEDKWELSINSWRGADKFIPLYPTLADKLKTIESNTVIDIVKFTLRNTDGYKYIETDYKRRNIDYKDMYPRLNNEMIQNMYKSIPDINKGEYIEENSLPHAFMRDGNIQKNQAALVSILKRLLK